MIQEFIKRFDENKRFIREAFAARPPESYEDLIGTVVKYVEGDEYGHMDPSRITKIDHGNYQGTLVFIIGEEGYQPSTYWYVKVSYGSCSGCDTLQAIYDYGDEPPTESQLDDYMTLALHIVQGLKKMGEKE